MTLNPFDAYLVSRALTKFPQAGGQLLEDGNTRPGLRARAAAHAAFKAAQHEIGNLSAASQFVDPEVAEEIRGDLRDAVLEQLRTRSSAQLAGYRAAAERAHAEASAAAALYRPKLDPESAAQAIRTDSAWNNHIKPMLEDGKGWDLIIATADLDALLAVERFAGGYEARMRDTFHQHEVAPILAGIKSASERRLPNIVSPEGRAALIEQQHTARALEFVDRISRSTASIDGNASALSVNISVKRAGKAIGADQPVDTSPEAQAAYQESLQAPAAA